MTLFSMIKDYPEKIPVAPWPHLQAVAASAGQAHGSYDYRADP